MCKHLSTRTPVNILDYSSGHRALLFRLTTGDVAVYDDNRSEESNVTVLRRSNHLSPRVRRLSRKCGCQAGSRNDRPFNDKLTG